MSLWTHPLPIPAFNPDRFFAARGNPKIATVVHAVILVTTILLLVYGPPYVWEPIGLWLDPPLPLSFRVACYCSNTLRAFLYLIPFAVWLLLRFDYYLLLRFHRLFGPALTGKVAFGVASGLISLLLYSWWAVFCLYL